MNDQLNSAPSSVAPQTRNPQTVSSQNLAAPTSNLQPSLNQATTSNFRITSVGDTDFTPFEGQETTTSQESTPVVTKSNSKLVPVLSIGLLVLVICALISWYFYRQSTKNLIKHR